MNKEGNNKKNKRSTIFVIVGPSGVGKTTLIDTIKGYNECYTSAITHTTRPKRENEVDGVHYHFATRGDMESDVQRGLFLETASYADNLYGTSCGAVEKVLSDGKVCLLVVDTQGASNLKKQETFDCKFFFVMPPSLAELRARLRKRGEKEEEVSKRMKEAQREIDTATINSLYDVILTNDNLEDTARSLDQHIQRLCSARG